MERKKVFDLQIFFFGGVVEYRFLPFLKKWAKPGYFLFIFVLFSHCMYKCSTNLTIIEKSIDGMLGSGTRVGRMEGADESTELLRHP